MAPDVALPSVREGPLPNRRLAIPLPAYGVVVVTLAHQGGWDEWLMVVVPLALVSALLVVANRRANQEQARRQAEEAAQTEPETT